MKKIMIWLILYVSVVVLGCDTSTSSSDDNIPSESKGTYNFVATVDGEAVEAYWNIYQYYDVSNLTEIDLGVQDVDNDCVIKGNLTSFHCTVDFNQGTQPGFSQTTVYPNGKLEYRISKSGYEIERGTVWINEGENKTKVIELTAK